MRPKQIESKLRKLVGKHWWYRENKRAPDPTEREAARAALPGLRQAEQEAKKAADDRRIAILLADRQYVRLCAARDVAIKARDKAAGLAFYYRVELGKQEGIGIHIMAEGDTYDEAFAKLAEKVSR